MTARTDADHPVMSHFFRNYLKLIKFRLLSLVLVSTCMGFYISNNSLSSISVLLYALIGITLVGGGANSLNQWKERDADALMLRTKNRPLPAQRLTPNNALGFGILISCCGFVALGYYVNSLTLVLSFLSWAIYLFVYTPLKTRTVLNTWIGAVPGAIPAVLGATAASGTLEISSLALFLTLYVWQMPHFFAISWIYRDDYLRGGFKMLSWNDDHGATTALHILAHSILLIPISTWLFWSGDSGLVYLFAAVASGFVFLYFALQFYLNTSKLTAKKLFHYSILYLPLLFAAIILDHMLVIA